MIDDERKQWLQGAYQDRLIEVAMHFAAERAQFIDAEWTAYIESEFDYLSELTAEDHGFLRDQAGLEAWKRIRDNNIKQRKAAFGAVRAEHPDVFSGDAELFAFDIGWSGLLLSAAERVGTYPSRWHVRVTGGKEKFGCLIIHIDCDYSARGCRSEVERLREEIRLRSLATCEICGRQGRLRLSSVAKTVCVEHRSVLGELRDDDGMYADPWRWHEEQPVDHHIADVIANGRAMMAAADRDESTDPMRRTALGRRIDDDTWRLEDRERELLIQYGYYIMQAVIAAKPVVDHQRADWIFGEMEHWDEYAAAPLSDTDRQWLLEYILKLVSERDQTNN